MYYEVCLAVVEHVTVYYIHKDLCQEVKTLGLPEDLNIISLKKTSPPIIKTKNVTVIPNKESLTLTWHIDVSNTSDTSNQLVSVIRQISIREFGSNNATQLFVLEDFNMTSLMLSKKEAGALRYVLY